jgi:hypothetical protein
MHHSAFSIAHAKHMGTPSMSGSLSSVSPHMEHGTITGLGGMRAVATLCSFPTLTHIIYRFSDILIHPNRFAVTLNTENTGRIINNAQCQPSTLRNKPQVIQLIIPVTAGMIKVTYESLIWKMNECNLIIYAYLYGHRVALRSFKFSPNKCGRCTKPPWTISRRYLVRPKLTPL